jgi:hypothetical protein
MLGEGQWVIWTALGKARTPGACRADDRSKAALAVVIKILITSWQHSWHNQAEH